VKTWKPAPEEIEALRVSMAASPEPASLQPAVSRWFRHVDPFTGEDRGVTAYPNRITPRTIRALIESVALFNARAYDRVQAAIDEGIGIPGLWHTGEDNAALSQLELDTARMGERLQFYRDETDRAFAESPDLILEPTVPPLAAWGEAVVYPLLFGQYPQGQPFQDHNLAGATSIPDFVKPLIYARTADVGGAALSEALDQLKRDLTSPGLDIAGFRVPWWAALAGGFVAIGAVRGLLRR
jgi:hypothetical protein